MPTHMGPISSEYHQNIIRTRIRDSTIYAYYYSTVGPILKRSKGINIALQVIIIIWNNLRGHIISCTNQSADGHAELRNALLIILSPR